MLGKIRLAITTVILFAFAAVAAFTATQGFVPKYDAGGALVDSTIYESGGNVGIGTTSPVRQLTIDHASAAVVGLYTGGNERALLKGLAEGSLAFDTGGNERARLTGAGNLGIGLTAPTSRLHVAGGGVVFDRHTGDVDPTNAQGSIWVKQDALNNYEAMMFRATAYQFQKDDGTNYLTVADGGNVGVGTAAPSAKLHVAGNVTVDGNIGAKYQDVAEWVPTTEKMHAGSVVSLDLTRSNHVRASTREYDSTVAGVVSARPGVILGEPGRSKALIATTGRVLVRVDASRGPIAIGDLLVTSDKPGVAMKSVAVTIGDLQVHRTGTILGKALEPITTGEGQILVLLSLQ